ncbi:MAG TPA: hypothetical protein VJ063_20295, partial [Verrucomicrobiae bacterium]|nr:hypothetical protein [Verrucomicrobiae bacterium]
MKALLSLIGIMACSGMAMCGEIVPLTPSADTTLFQSFPDNNLGGITSLAVGTTAHGLVSRALIKFDVAGRIPPDAIVTSARLRTTIARAPLGPQP